MCTPHHTQIGRHEPHGCAGSFDVYHLRHIADGIDDDLCIITVAQVLGQSLPSAERIDDECAV